MGHNVDPHGSRESWGSRSAFILAAIGSAVGLGNLWGFPYKLYTYGGGAFLIPYFIAMAVMGVPLLIMEFSVGHWAQEGPPNAFARISGRYRFVGWWLVSLAFIIITYYTVILGYCVVFLIESIEGMFSGFLPWGGTNQAAGEHFTSMLAHEKGSYALDGIRWLVLGGMIASWALIYLCLFKGVKWVSKVVLITVPLPWIMLLVLTLRGLTLPGAETGLQYYLEPDWSKLLEVDTWRFAFGQVFFSMSLGFAVMLSYASFLHRRSDLNNNALIIGLGDLATSFIAGIAVFSTLGAMAMADGTAVESVVDGGPGLAFVTFPYALSRLPTAPAVFSMVFFVALLTLGIDSAFSIVEACLTSVCDSKKHWPRTYVLPGICVFGATVGVIYCCGSGGLNILGFVDNTINGPMGILVVALAECLVVGWALKGRMVRVAREHANERSDWKVGRWWEVIIRFVAPALLIALIVWSIADAVATEEWTNLGASAAFFLIPVAFWFFSSGRKKDTSSLDSETPPPGSMVPFLLGIPLGSAAVGGIIGLVRLKLRGQALVTAATDAQGFVDRKLGAVAYTILAVALLVIFGGLIWCFWKALQAAGKDDPAMRGGDPLPPVKD